MIAALRALILFTVPVALAQPPFLPVPSAPADALRFDAPLPPFEAKDITGRTWRLNDLRGKLTLIYIWNTGEARAADQLESHARENLHALGLPELPELQRFYNEQAHNRNVQVLTFCSDYDYMHAHDYMKERKYTFPVIADWVLTGKLFPKDARLRQWLVSADARLSNPLRSWSFGRVLFEAERTAGQADTRAHFEVASIKPSAAGSRTRWAFTPGKATLLHSRLKDLIPLAYGLQPFLVSGGPAWFESDFYDIAGELAVEPSAPPTREQALEAVQVLLEDRCKLRSHRESKTLPLYKLTIAKGGFKLKDGDDLPDGTPMGSEGRTTSRLVRKKAPLSSLVAALSAYLGSPVEDHTGLHGVYSFVLEWHHEQPGDSDFAMFAALSSQLGLTLEKGKGPVETLVIDSAEKPGDN